ncbi:prephenate dehydrogenase [Elusimicrobiota bacterium]
MKKYDKISILGMGLLGGAIGKRILKKNIADTVCGWGRNEQRLANAFKLNTCNKTATDLKESIIGSELIIIATPPDTVISQLKQLASIVTSNVLIMDIASTKTSIVDAAVETGIFQTGAQFIGCHPIAGLEKTGVMYSDEVILENAPCIITPVEQNLEIKLEEAETFWNSLGMYVIRLNPGLHDELLGIFSHIPHILSSVLMKSAYENIDSPEIIPLISGPSYKQMSRLSASDPVLWSQIYRHNKKEIVDSLSLFIKELIAFKDALNEEKEDIISDILIKAYEYREKSFNNPDFAIGMKNQNDKDKS